jgi:hypothetical protein
MLAECHPSFRTGEKRILRSGEPIQQHFSFELVSGDYEYIPEMSHLRFS